MTMSPAEAFVRGEIETVTMSRNEQFAKGIITTDDLTEDEIMSLRILEPGQVGSNYVVPKRVHRDLVAARNRLIFEEADGLFQTSAADAVRVVREIMGDPNVQAGDRLKAAGMILDRTVPKDMRITVKATDAVEALFTELLKTEDILDADIVDDGSGTV